MMGGDDGGHAASAGAGVRAKLLTTYVNSRKCSQVSSDKRGALQVVDGRFALNPKGFNLFGSSSRSSCVGSGGSGLLLKYVSVARGAMSEEEVLLGSHRNRIFSRWQQEQAEEAEKRMSSLALRPLYKHPPW